MSIEALRFSPPRLRVPRILLGGVAVGTFDLVFACTWWFIAARVPPIRIFQSIAEGLYGAASFEGGLRTATIGVLTHYLIATCMVFAYALVATHVPALVRRPWQWGAAYGLFLYALMNFIVVPLSAAGSKPMRPAWMIASVVVHVLIGIACACIARGSLRRQ
jgi:uncharacterized membrane protein YagU involved in acid resistance